MFKNLWCVWDEGTRLLMPAPEPVTLLKSLSSHRGPTAQGAKLQEPLWLDEHSPPCSFLPRSVQETIKKKQNLASRNLIPKFCVCACVCVLYVPLLIIKCASETQQEW